MNAHRDLDRDSDQVDVRHDPLKYAIRWARAVLWQADRLREALKPPGPRDGLRPGFFDRSAIEQHFLLTASCQLLRALDALEDDIRLPGSISKRLKILRNVREHWDDWDLEKGSQKEFRRLWPGQSPYVLARAEGDILVGGVASLAELEFVARHVLAVLEQRKAETQ